MCSPLGKTRHLIRDTYRNLAVFTANVEMRFHRDVQFGRTILGELPEIGQISITRL